MLDKTVELIALEMEKDYSPKAIKEFIRSTYGVEYDPDQNSMRAGKRPPPALKSGLTLT